MYDAAVEKYDAVGRYFVQSASRPGKHLVDLMAFGGFGECACEHFQMKLIVELRNDRPCKPCSHIIAAKVEFATEVLEHMLSNALDGTVDPAR